jgi:hypothetical protein
MAKKKRKGSTKATGRDYSKQKRYNATKEQTAKRVELNRYNRQHGTYGNGDQKDASHSASGKIKGYESQSKNRARKTGFTTGKRKARKKK